MMPSIVRRERNLFARISLRPTMMALNQYMQTLGISGPALFAGELGINVLRNLAVADLDLPRRDRGDFGVVGDEGDGAALLAEVVEELEDGLAGVGVEVAGRLIGEDDAWGRLTRARAMAARCCWPPESWSGRWLRAVVHLDEAAALPWRARGARWRGSRHRSSGSSTFWRTLSFGSRLKNWKTKPILRFRMRASSRMEAVEISVPSSLMLPLLGESRQPRMCMSVDLPLPEGPMIEMNSPPSMSRSTLSSARISSPPRW